MREPTPIVFTDVAGDPADILALQDAPGLRAELDRFAIAVAHLSRRERRAACADLYRTTGIRLSMKRRTIR
jgi:hypothetical protein